MAEARSSRPGAKRLVVLLSVLIFVLSGIPIWWKLTEVYRTPLPYSEIEALSILATKENLSLPVQLQVVLVSRKAGSWNRESFFDRFSKDLAQQAGDLNEGSKLDLTITLDTESGCFSKGDHRHWQCGLDLGLDRGDPIDELLRDNIRSSSTAGAYTIVVLLDSQDSAGSVQGVVGKYRHAWITGQGLETLSSELLDCLAKTASILVRDAQKDHLMPLAADATATLSFSLLNANPQDWIYTWDFESVKERFLSPIVNVLSPVARLFVESQILYYTPSTGRSHWDPKMKSYVVEAKDMPFFINANEWHLDTSIAAAGRSKVLHFAVYIPAASECPLQFRLPNGQVSTTNAFTSPGWGGVAVWNPRNWSLVGNELHLVAKDLLPTMEVIVAQLRTLFGLPAHSAYSSVKILPSSETGFADWEVDILLRRRSIADANATVSTLSSLARLVKSLPNMVIQDEIGAQVQASLEALHGMLNSHHAPSYAAFSKMARDAREWSEAAFFHPSIMSLLHFPKEHNFAIYTPFFAPMLLGTLASIYKETTRYVRERRRFRKQDTSTRA